MTTSRIDISYGDKAFDIADRILADFKAKHNFIISYGMNEMKMINSIFHLIQIKYDIKPGFQKVLSVILFEFKLRTWVYPAYRESHEEHEKTFKGLSELQLLLNAIQKNEAETDEIILKGKKRVYSENASKNIKQFFNISIKGEKAISLLLKIISGSKEELDKWADYDPLKEAMVRSKEFSRKSSLPKLRMEFAAILEEYLIKNISFKSKNDLYFLGGSLLADMGLMPASKRLVKDQREWRVFVVSNFKKALGHK